MRFDPQRTGRRVIAADLLTKHAVESSIVPA
jgi:hypothetical protein